MVSIIGFVVVIFCVLGGYLMEGGKFHVLFQPVELMIILGTAIGSILVSCSTKLVKAIVSNVAGIFGPPPADKNKYFQTIKLLYELFKMAAGNPLSLETHVDKPESSELFKRYPLVLNDHHVTTFISNTLIIQVSANIAPHDLEELMDTDIHTIHEEEGMVPKTLYRVADALPGLGIVAAVLGIVITMGRLAEGKEAIGHSVAAALVGTFLGVLLSYGFFQPIAAKTETRIQEKTQILHVIKSGIIAFAKGCNPKVCAEFARRTVPLEYRPSFSELDQATSNIKSKAA